MNELEPIDPDNTPLGRRIRKLFWAAYVITASYSMLLITSGLLTTP